MAERGAALVEMLIVTAISAAVWAAAIGVIGELPARTAAWDAVSAERQTARAIEARVARLAAAASAIEIELDGAVVRVPAVWPRRIGLLRADAPGVVSAEAVTVLSRTDGHREVSLSSALPPGGGVVSFDVRAGCGTAAACGLRAGDLVMAIDARSSCALFRVTAAASSLDLDALTPGVTFPPGATIVPVSVNVIAFDRDESAIRLYDGYRSDNVVADGIAAAVIAHRGPAGLRFDDGPFAGEGMMAFDVDQLAITGIGLDMTLVAGAGGVPSRVRLAWRVR